MKTDEAVEILWQSLHGGAHPPAALRKQLTLAEAYQVQLGVLARWVAAGEKHAGWKIGGTSPAARQMLGVQEPLYGYLLASRQFPSDHTFEHARLTKPLIESELCITVGERLRGPGVTREHVLGAVAAVAPAFEIAEMRGDMASDVPSVVADNVAQWGYVVGAAVTPYPRELDLGAITAEMRKNGEVVQHVRGQEVIDDQLQSIAALANHLARYGLALEAGQRILTGSMTRPVPIAKGDRWETRFSAVGRVAAAFV
jgi:2-keto-4-pentenoate hydratase